MEAVGVELPWPPSLNRYYRVFRNRILISRDGRKYRMMVVSRMGGLNRKLTGDVSVEIDLYPPDRRRRDIDNPLKCLLDSMTHAGVYEDDSQIKDIELHMREPMPPEGLVHVTLKEK
ncbi:MAG: RusA family crossover junction endodeoxyribonuclease [bacterium]|nr:RusA family crossover junction endodeoxyribonuclease [Candidatus Colisoma equi]